jgi:hypothetical protein
MTYLSVQNKDAPWRGGRSSAQPWWRGPGRGRRGRGTVFVIVVCRFIYECVGRVGVGGCGCRRVYVSLGGLFLICCGQFFFGCIFLYLGVEVHHSALEHREAGQGLWLCILVLSGGAGVVSRQPSYFTRPCAHVPINAYTHIYTCTHKHAPDLVLNGRLRGVHGVEGGALHHRLFFFCVYR